MSFDLYCFLMLFVALLSFPFRSSHYPDPGTHHLISGERVKLVPVGLVYIWR